MRIMYPNSTLTKSPHLEKTRVESYPDNDVDWTAAVKAFQTLSATSPSVSIEQLVREGTKVSDDGVEELREAFRI